MNIYSEPLSKILKPLKILLFLPILLFSWHGSMAEKPRPKSPSKSFKERVSLGLAVHPYTNKFLNLHSQIPSHLQFLKSTSDLKSSLGSGIETSFAAKIELNNSFDCIAELQHNFQFHKTGYQAFYNDGKTYYAESNGQISFFSAMVGAEYKFRLKNVPVGVSFLAGRTTFLVPLNEYVVGDFTWKTAPISPPSIGSSFQASFGIRKNIQRFVWNADVFGRLTSVEKGSYWLETLYYLPLETPNISGLSAVVGLKFGCFYRLGQ